MAKKSINYWSKFNVDLIVIDGSNEKLDNINKLNTNDSCRLRYFHVLGSYYQRLLFASKISLKKYILMSCDDDEIHLIQGVLESIRFLEKNTNFVASIGRCLKISIDSKNKLKEEIIYKRFEKVNKIVNVEDKTKEFLVISMNLFASYYSVIRSDLWKKNLNLICNLQLSSPYIYERLIELSNISQGEYLFTIKLHG